MESARKPSLVEKLKAMPAMSFHKNPLMDLEGEAKKEWEELKAALRAGALNHLSMNKIHKQVCAHFNIRLPRSTFRDLLIREGILKPQKKSAK